MTATAETVVLEVSGVQWATEKVVVEAVLGRRPGVWSVEANLVAQAATVSYDPARTSVAELAERVRDCGYHCQGQSVPRICATRGSSLPSTPTTTAQPRPLPSQRRRFPRTR